MPLLISALKVKKQIPLHSSVGRRGGGGQRFGEKNNIEYNLAKVKAGEYLPLSRASGEQRSRQKVTI